MKINHFIGAGLVSTSLIATGAQATNWSGIYFGGHTGQSFFSRDSLLRGNSNDPTGVSGGLQAGIQLQLGSFILGVESTYTALDIDDIGFTNINNGTSTATAGVGDSYSALGLGNIDLTELTNDSSPTLADAVDALSDLDLGNIDLSNFANGTSSTFTGLGSSDSGSGTSDVVSADPNEDTPTFTAGVSDIFTVAARGGYAFGNMMAYGKIGYATAGIGYHNMVEPTAASLLNFLDRESGLLLGAGTEYAITEDVSIGVGYTYINFNIDEDIQEMSFAELPSVIRENLDSDHHQLNVRLNFRFN